VTTLLAGKKRNGQTVLCAQQSTGRESTDRAGRLVKTVEIEPELARMSEAVVGKFRIEKSAGAVSRLLAGGVAEDEEQFLIVGISRPAPAESRVLRA